MLWTIVMRQAAIAYGRSSDSRRSPKAAIAFASSQRSFLIVTGSASCCASQVSVDEFGERQGAAKPAYAAQHFELSDERLACITLRPKPTALDALGIAAADSVAVSPKRFAVGPLALQPQDLTLLQHRRSLLSADPASGHHRARACEDTRPDQSDLATRNG
jgi:hypothetical protein